LKVRAAEPRRVALGDRLEWIMERISTIIGCARVALAGSLGILVATGATASQSHKAITCKYLNAYELTFDVPTDFGDLPAIYFVYPSKATIFNFRGGVFSLPPWMKKIPLVCVS
jgi:hypothetical protein